MRALSLLSLCCFIATAAAELTQLEQLFLDGQCEADDSLLYIGDVEAKIQPFLDAANDLSDAANVLTQLATVEGNLDNILGDIDNLEGVERADRRAASVGVGDLQKVPRIMNRQYGVLRNKLEKAVVYATDLRTDLAGYRTTVQHDTICEDCLAIPGCTSCAGGICIACTDDTVLSEDRTECQACGAAFEHCLACSGGVCVQCPSNTVLTDGVCVEAMTNLALNRPVSHDSNYGTCHVHYATDGHTSAITTSNCDLLQCEHTACNAGAHWLAIDLEEEREFSHVIVLNREGSTSTRLRDVVVYTTSSMPSLGDPLPTEVTRCGEYSGILDEAVFSTIQCDSVVTGRYVIVAMPNAPTCFTVCEVEIYNAPCLSLPVLDNAVTSYNKYECSGDYVFSSTGTSESPAATCSLVNRGPYDDIAFQWTNIPQGNCEPAP